MYPEPNEETKAAMEEARAGDERSQEWQSVCKHSN